MSANRSSAVMQQRAAAIVEADDAQRALWRKLDFFPTPPWAARACAEYVLALDPCARRVVEPAAGEGHFVEPLREYFETVYASDIHDYGRGYFVGDFIDGQSMLCDWVITNPPFKDAEAFVRKGLLVARRGVAVLCRIALLEGAGRFLMFSTPETQLTHVCVFAERVPMQLGSWDPELSSATCYALFVFDKHRAGSAPVVNWFRPGTKGRLTKPDDVRRFARKAPAPLFD